ncbi:MAG: outer membrane protein TolC precursor, partial [Pseudomonadota bacterium]
MTAPLFDSRRSTALSHTRQPGAWGRVGLAVALLCAGAGVQAQSLTALYGAAQGFDATYQAAKSAHEAAQAKAEQARAGLLPTVGLSSSASWSDINNASPVVDRNVNAQNVAVAASQPLYRPTNRLNFEQGQKSLVVAKAQL